FSHIDLPVKVYQCPVFDFLWQEQTIVSAALLEEWSTDEALIRKFVTWVGQDCHRLSQKQNVLSFQKSFDLKLGGVRRRALQDAACSMRYCSFLVRNFCCSSMISTATMY